LEFWSEDSTIDYDAVLSWGEKPRFITGVDIPKNLSKGIAASPLTRSAQVRPRACLALEQATDIFQAPEFDHEYPVKVTRAVDYGQRSMQGNRYF